MMEIPLAHCGRGEMVHSIQGKHHSACDDRSRRNLKHNPCNILYAIVITLSLALVACRERVDPPTPLELQIPKGFPTVLNIPADNPLTVEGVELGRMLFHDPHLCGYTGTEPDSLMSCATCHRQECNYDLGTDNPRFPDGKPRGRTTGKPTIHNVMPLMNLVFNYEGYLWNGGQTEERPFPVREVSELLDGYFSNILPEFIAKLYDSIKSGKTAGLKGILDNCVGQKCEWCENGRQCIKELKEGSRTQVIPYLSVYAQKYARKLRAPEGIKDFKKFVSDMDNRKLLSCNRSWDYIINDGVTVEVQSEAAPYKWEDIKNTDYKWKNVKSLTLPRWQDVMVVLTAQKYAGDNRVYALGIYTNEYKGQGEAPAEDNETGHSSNWETGSFIFISEENTEDAYRENVGSFVKKLHEVLEKYDTLNRQTGPGERKISLQGYVMDPYELMNLEEVLYETLETETDTGLIGEVMDILFWMQGEKLVETEGDKPHETEFPVIVIGRELRKLISLPLPVAYRLPDVMRAMKVWVEEDMLFTKEDHEDYFELISNVMKSDVIHRVWNEGKKDETEKIREHITKRLYSEGRILIKMQGEGRKNNSLVRSISGFYMPGRISYQNDLLRKWAFEVRLENLLAYHQIRGGRLKELDIAKAEGTIIEMEVTGLGDVGTAYGRPCRQIKLHTDSLTADFTGGWFSAAIVKTDHLMDLYRFNDHKYSDNKVFLDDLGILGGIEYSKSNNSLTVVADLSGSENTVKSFNINDHVYISNRFTDFNSDKIYREFSQIDRGENKDLLDPARMGRITGILNYSRGLKI